MCSFLLSNTEIVSSANIFAKNRGPDETNLTEVEGINFLHNLLHITGSYTTQPVAKNGVVAIFNGEIYNFESLGDFSSDAFSILEAYKTFGDKFAKFLDGEFSICIIDFNLNKILIAADPFACKPLWYDFQNENFAIGSYESQVLKMGFSNPVKLKGNSTKVYDLKSLNLLNEFSNIDFDIEQHKDSFDDWILAFENSIAKRTRNTSAKIFLGLSSGHDSGAIACELLKQSVPFKSFTISAAEVRSIIDKRIDLISREPSNESSLIHLTRAEFEERKNQLKNDCEDFSHEKYNFKNDKASYGLAAICDRAKEEGRRIYLSGQGADEIISDYGFNGKKCYSHSQFGGKFPKTLNGFFPWRSFYGGRQVQYLNKEEYTAGHFGIEARYPFLDKDLVQEFLWLKSSLKNSRYKSVISEYLERNSFPFMNRKIGFSCQKGLK